MATKLSAEQSKAASEILGRLDKVAGDIQSNFEAWGMPFEAAKSLVNHLDHVADDFEKTVFGSESLQKRQVEVLKTAQVIQRDPDEGYMDTFQSEHGVVQAEADEPYMTAYRDDQSSAVRHGQSTTGRPLAPGHERS